MKILLLIALSILSLGSFAGEVGEVKKTECPYLDQSKREAKAVAAASGPEKSKEKIKVISK